LNHLASPRFWAFYGQLPPEIRLLADKNFALLKADPRHPSLQLKKVGENVYSVRVGLNHRALARERPEGLQWFWIGSHADYERILRS
jgi:hypothetical protein